MTGNVDGIGNLLLVASTKVGCGGGDVLDDFFR